MADIRTTTRRAGGTIRHFARRLAQWRLLHSSQWRLLDETRGTGATGALFLALVLVVAVGAGARRVDASGDVSPLAGAPVERSAADIESRPLGPARAGGFERAPSRAGEAGVWTRTVGALALVVSLIVGTWWLVRRAARRGGWIGAAIGAARAPSGVIEVLGRYPVSRGATLLLLRLDRRVLLLSQTPAGLRTLADIADPDEVASILVKARDDEGATSAERFNDLLREMARDPGVIEEPPGATGEAAAAPMTTLRRRLSRLLEVRA